MIINKIKISITLTPQKNLNVVNKRSMETKTVTITNTNNNNETPVSNPNISASLSENLETKTDTFLEKMEKFRNKFAEIAENSKNNGSGVNNQELPPLPANPPIIDDETSIIPTLVEKMSRIADNNIELLNKVKETNEVTGKNLEASTKSQEKINEKYAQNLIDLKNSDVSKYLWWAAAAAAASSVVYAVWTYKDTILGKIIKKSVTKVLETAVTNIPLGTKEIGESISNSIDKISPTVPMVMKENISTILSKPIGSLSFQEIPEFVHTLYVEHPIFGLVVGILGGIIFKGRFMK